MSMLRQMYETQGRMRQTMAADKNMKQADKDAREKMIREQWLKVIDEVFRQIPDMVMPFASVHAWTVYDPNGPGELEKFILATMKNGTSGSVILLEPKQYAACGAATSTDVVRFMIALGEAWAGAIEVDLRPQPTGIEIIFLIP